jgi:hypothetical protein
MRERTTRYEQGEVDDVAWHEGSRSTLEVSPAGPEGFLRAAGEVRCSTGSALSPWWRRSEIPLGWLPGLAFRLLDPFVHRPLMGSGAAVGLSAPWVPGEPSGPGR